MTIIVEKYFQKYLNYEFPCVSDGREIWICPGCGKQDDGSPMIGCDSCDDWYHWVCVNIHQEPADEDWFCPRCRSVIDLDCVLFQKMCVNAMI